MHRTTQPSDGEAGARVPHGPDLGRGARNVPRGLRGQAPAGELISAPWPCRTRCLHLGIILESSALSQAWGPQTVRRGTFLAVHQTWPLSLHRTCLGPDLRDSGAQSLFLKSFPSDRDMGQGVKPPLRGATAPRFWAKCPTIKRNSHLSGGLGRSVPTTGLFKHPPRLPNSGLPVLTSALTGTWASCFLAA